MDNAERRTFTDLNRMIKNTAFALVLVVSVCLLAGVKVGAETHTQVRFISEYATGHFPGEILTFACVIEDVSDLIGVEVLISWNTTYLDYLSHTIVISNDVFPYPTPPSPYAGILHTPRLSLKDDVNSTAGTYWISLASPDGPSFNGSGTVFTITLATMSPHPHMFVDTAVDFELVRLYKTTGEIEHVYEDAVVRILRWDVDNHDVAVRNLSLSKVGGLPMPSVGEGHPLDVAVEIENQGGYTETFTAKVYANTTLIGELHAFIPQEVTLTFLIQCNTAGLSMGNHTIHTIVEITSDDIEPADNSMIDETVVLVTITGDADADQDVDIFDIVRFATAYGAEKPDIAYNPNCDINDDDNIDIFDIVIAIRNYGESW